MPESVLRPAPVSTASRLPPRIPRLGAKPPARRIQRNGGGRRKAGKACHSDPGRWSLIAVRPAKCGQCLAVLRQVAGLAARIDDDVPDDALGVDDEGAPQGHAAARSNTPYTGYCPMRPEVGQEVEPVALLLRVGPQGELTVHGYRQDHGVGVFESGQIVPDLAQLTGADPRERKGIEHHYHVPAAELGQPDGLAVLVDQFKVRRLLPTAGTPGRSPGGFNLVSVICSSCAHQARGAPVLGDTGGGGAGAGRRWGQRPGYPPAKRSCPGPTWGSGPRQLRLRSGW